MLAKVRSLSTHGKGAIIVVAPLDRLGGRLLEAVRCRDTMKALGVEVHSVRRVVRSRTWLPTFSARLPTMRSFAGESVPISRRGGLVPDGSLSARGVFPDRLLDKSMPTARPDS